MMGRQVWSSTRAVLTRAPRWTWAWWHRLLKLTLTVFLTVLYPVEGRSMRHSIPAEVLLLAMLSCNGVMYMMRFPESTRGSRTARLLPKLERRRLFGETDTTGAQWRLAVNEVLDRQERVFTGDFPHPVDGGAPLCGLYDLCGCYLGQGLVWRSQVTRPGLLVWAGMEHGQYTFFTHFRESQKKQYVLIRRNSPGTMSFVVARTGPKRAIEVMETLAINAEDAKGNARKKDRHHRGPRTPRRRDGHGRDGRKRGKGHPLSGPLDSPEARKKIRAAARRAPDSLELDRHELTRLAAERWAWGYK
jgi:hypothetical protein